MITEPSLFAATWLTVTVMLVVAGLAFVVGVFALEGRATRQRVVLGLCVAVSGSLLTVACALAIYNDAWEDYRRFRG